MARAERGRVLSTEEKHLPAVTWSVLNSYWLTRQARTIWRTRLLKWDVIAFLHDEMLFQLLLLCIATVAALPTWEGLNNRADFMSELVPTTTHIQVFGGDINSPNHLCSHTPGEPGNVTFEPTYKQTPALFSISQQQLWQYKNASTIYPVAVVNTTLFGTDDGPFLQLVLGKQPRTSSVVSGGSWKWRGTMLNYWYGPKSNGGVYFSCPTGGSRNGLFTRLGLGPTPEGCQLVTLHSFSTKI
ncbi:hypothetical protein MIND_00732400 [Mycena indigotica]|uniref:Uncharacterized protein n=1 Tax=Mycena indigotica TaxID=2126181 RepID=A0A8H6SLR6_9AGAR|nr:uncharacterized protein MIND_00732400 [Mycena indigotica]KAF7301669.1 hypothetical protein MIND_00732400 [Mycena indigotica]